MSQSSTDGSNNNQDFQTFLQDYLSDLIQNPSPTERNILQTPFSTNYYINPLYRQTQIIPPNLFNISYPHTNMEQIESSGVSMPANPYISNLQNIIRNSPVDIEYGSYMESILQNPYIFHTPQGNRTATTLPASRSYLDRLLQRSLETTEKKYKMVLSESGKDQIKHMPFSLDKFKEQKYCPISQKKFQEGEYIAQLPCFHIFEPDNIMKWVKQENATCPVCRFKLKSVEKKKTSTIGNDDDYDDDDDMPALESVPDSEVRENSGQTTIPATAIADIIPDNIAIQRVVNSFNFLSHDRLRRVQRDSSLNIIHPTGRRIPYRNRTRNTRGGHHSMPQIYNMLRYDEAIQEEQDLQAALMASLDTYEREEKREEHEEEHEELEEELEEEHEEELEEELFPNDSDVIMEEND